jgi:hypothetical protein
MARRTFPFLKDLCLKESVRAINGDGKLTKLGHARVTFECGFTQRSAGRGVRDHLANDLIRNLLTSVRFEVEVTHLCAGVRFEEGFEITRNKLIEIMSIFQEQTQTALLGTQPFVTFCRPMAK